jgi:isoquinoline 1-oxidoreductase beta subunit
MLTAVVLHAPRFGAKVKSFDATRAKAMPRVVDVVQIPSGVAVLAQDFWSAKQGRDALTVEWDDSAAFKQGTADIMAQYKELAKKPGKSYRKEGDVEQHSPPRRNDPGRIRIPVSRARCDGADELRHATRRRRCEV